MVDTDFEEWNTPPNYHQHQNINHSFHHPVYHQSTTSWPAHPMMHQHADYHTQQMHPTYHQHHVDHPKHDVIVSPFTLDAQVTESINDTFHHSISACDSDSERSDRSGHSNESTGLSSTSRSCYVSTPSSSDRSIVDVLTPGLTAADLRRPRVTRKRRMTSSAMAAETAVAIKPVAMMSEEEKRERNKQFAADYRKRRKNYVCDLESRLDAATSELSRKEESLRVALNEISSMKEQIQLFHSMAFKTDSISIPIVDPYKRGGINGMSKGRRVVGAKGAMSIAMLTFLSCLLCQFGFFDSSFGSFEVGFGVQDLVGFNGDIAMSTYQAGAPDCSAGGCHKNRFLQWETSNQIIDGMDVDVVVDSGNDRIDLDVSAAREQMQALVNATEKDWIGEGPRTAMGYLDVDSDPDLINDSADLVSMFADLFLWSTPTT